MLRLHIAAHVTIVSVKAIYWRSRKYKRQILLTNKLRTF
jgi:hypothetical protein